MILIFNMSPRRDIVDGLDIACTNIGRWLLRAGADVDIPDATKNTALHYSSAGGSIGMVQMLLEAGASANPLNDVGRTPLLLAVAMGHAQVAGKPLTQKLSE